MEKLFYNLLLIIFFPVITIYKLCKFFYHILIKKIYRNRLRYFNINEIDCLNGYEFEEFIAMLFFCMGYDSMVTKKSGDGGVDVIAKKHKKIIAIQTKLYYNHSVGNKAVQEIYAAKNLVNADYAIVITNSYFTNDAINLAKKLKVLLIDRKDLSNLLNKNNQILQIKNECVLMSTNKI